MFSHLFFFPFTIIHLYAGRSWTDGRRWAELVRPGGRRRYLSNLILANVTIYCSSRRVVLGAAGGCCGALHFPIEASTAYVTGAFATCEHGA